MQSKALIILAIHSTVHGISGHKLDVVSPEGPIAVRLVVLWQAYPKPLLPEDESKPEVGPEPRGHMHWTRLHSTTGQHCRDVSMKVSRNSPRLGLSLHVIRTQSCSDSHFSTVPGIYAGGVYAMQALGSALFPVSVAINATSRALTHLRYQWP